MTEIQRLAKIMVLKDMRKEYELRAKYNGGVDYDCYRALDMAIEELEQEPCTDAISRQAVLNLAKFDGRDGLGSIIHAFDVEQLPSVTPAEKVGKWKRISMDKYSEHAKYWYRCDRCGEDNLGNTNYCPNCGQRKMQEAEDEN